jgi:hypothetical protein
MAFLQRLLRMFQDNFPEILLRAVVVNAPWLFYGVWRMLITVYADTLHMLIHYMLIHCLLGVWRMLQTFITKSMAQKIKICGSDFGPDVAAIVASAHIPVFLGGDLTAGDGDGECKEIISAGGMIGLGT